MSFTLKQLQAEVEELITLGLGDASVSVEYNSPLSGIVATEGGISLVATGTLSQAPATVDPNAILFLSKHVKVAEVTRFSTLGSKIKVDYISEAGKKAFALLETTPEYKILVNVE